MKEHFKKYETTYLLSLTIICLILACIFIYLGTENKKKSRYSEEQAIGIMKLKADQFTRLMEIGASEDSCENTSTYTLTSDEMETYGFDKKFYKKITYTLKCENNKQTISISMLGKGNFSGYELKNYISNHSGN